jgi:hypothetical protein
MVLPACLPSAFVAGVVGNLKMGLAPPPNLVPPPDPADQHQGSGADDEPGAEPPPPPMTTQHRSTGLVTVLPQHDGTRTCVPSTPPRAAPRRLPACRHRGAIAPPRRPAAPHRRAAPPRRRAAPPHR